MRTKLIVANWKMNGSIDLIDKFFNAVSYFESENIDIVICPPDIFLNPMRNIFDSTSIFIGAQNVYSEIKGAFTGESSVSFLKECGIKWCIVGHSERREHFCETNEFISKKIEILLKYNVRPILCVGEKLEHRESGKYEEAVSEQLRIGLSRVSGSTFNQCIIAYEPVWAIGTGLTAEPDAVCSMHELIRKELLKISGKVNVDKIKIIYGGSVNPENAGKLISMEEIDGVLVGGASLIPEKFQKIVEYNKI